MKLLASKKRTGIRKRNNDEFNRKMKTLSSV